MKKFLQSLQDIQDECIDEVKKLKASQLPDTVAGVTIHSVGQHVSREEWDQMRDNIREHSKEWQKFKKDPNKIVLEKNFFINCLNFMQIFYIFRPVNDDGRTYIKVNETFFRTKPESPQPYLFATFLLLGAALLLTVIFKAYFYLIVPGILCLALAFWASDNETKKQKIKEEEWQKSFTNRPGAILPPAVFSRKQYYSVEESGDFIIEEDVKTSLVKIKLNESPFFHDYQAILSKTLEINRQTKGQISWLWQFAPYTLLKDDFSITYQDFIGRTLDQTLCININVKSSNIMPIIETEHSFIFCLDNFSDEMEKHYFIPDGIIETLRKRTKNSSGTTINDGLFRLNEL